MKLSILLLHFSFFIVSVSGESPVTCSSDNVACNDNGLDSIGGVADIEECRQLCYDNDDCQFITYYGPDSFPLRETCFLLSSCEETHTCTDCLSETKSCYQTCGTNVVGVIDDNNLATFFDVEIEGDCREHCRTTTNCSFYTYFLEGDPNSKLCIALSYLIEPLQPCDNCLTGPLECEDIAEIKGLMITGGFGTDRSVEIIDILNNRGCQLDDLPDDRWGQTQNGNLLCGGGSGSGTRENCLTWTDGSWTVSHNLLHGRPEHVSWETDDGVLLIGGFLSRFTTEMVTWQGTTEERFTLKYPNDESCLIDEGQSFLLTGGYFVGTEKKVSRYNINGWQEDLEDFNTGRYGHGCTRYTNKDGDKVNLVCGGTDGYIRFDSCEENLAGTRHWSYTTSLPRSLAWLKGVSLDNRVLMTGGFDTPDIITGRDREEILELVDNEWRQVATMRIARHGHALTIININDYWRLCKEG